MAGRTLTFAAVFGKEGTTPMSPRKRKDNVLPFVRTKTQPLPPLKAPALPEGLGLRVSLGGVDVTRRPARPPLDDSGDPFDFDAD